MNHAVHVESRGITALLHEIGVRWCGNKALLLIIQAYFYGIKDYFQGIKPYFHINDVYF
jgi:hypothetical protein